MVLWLHLAQKEIHHLGHQRQGAVHLVRRIRELAMLVCVGRDVFVDAIVPGPKRGSGRAQVRMAQQGINKKIEYHKTNMRRVTV